MPLRFTNRIIEHLAHARYAPGSSREIARDMRVDDDERDAFEQAIQMLADEQRIDITPDGRIRLPGYGDELVGRLKVNARGFGFIRPEKPTGEGDLFVPRNGIRDAVSGDLVRAKVIHQPWRDKAQKDKSPYIGRIVEVIERGQDNFVGTLINKRGNWFVRPDGKSLHDPVLIRDPHAKNAKAGDKVVIELVHYPEDDYQAEGVITRVLGEAGRPDVETAAVITAHGLRTDFTDDVLDEARAASRTFDAALAEGIPEDREDLTDRYIITIDPPDAKDFDDAISIEYDEAEGVWTLGVHIADVSTFVPPGGVLDEEAKARGNSVYLPRLVLPMLPEVLSNGVCSLQEGVQRFTKSAFMQFDGKGRVVGQRAASTIIKSAKRLTYLEAQGLIDGNEKEARQHARTEPVYTDRLVDTLRMCNTLAKLLRERRRRDGMIVLNLPEVELVFDDDGHVIDAVPEDDAFTHTIIEMFMVEANEAIARLFEDIGVPILRRIHPDPVHGDMTELQMYARACQMNVPDEPDRHDIQHLLEASRDTPAGRALHFAVLRTLTKATYSPAMIGHYALASDHYAHFTSPIRRYPDLTLHRALQAYLDATDNGRSVPGGRKRRALGKRVLDDRRTLDEGELIAMGHHCTDTENEAEQAERELREFLVMQFLHDHHLGDEFRGVVTGVAFGGVFVSVERFLVEGLVHGQDLPQSSSRADRWEISETTGRLHAGRSGASIGIGDIVTVQIVAVDLTSRHLDLRITELPDPPAHLPQSSPSKKDKSAQRNGGRGKHKDKGKRKGHNQGRRGKRGRR
jgi:ribonuclease R